MDSRSDSAKKIPIQGVIFDYGNVLCQPQQPSDIASMAEVCRLPVPQFEEIYWKFRSPYDRGDLDGNAYWKQFPWPDEQDMPADVISRLVELDSQSWSRPNHASVAWARELRQAGIRLALLSNMPLELSRYISAHSQWLSVFDHLIFSCDVRWVKPAPEIYQLCLEKLNLPGKQVLFLDDIPANIEGADRLQIHGAVFNSIENTRLRVERRFTFFPAARS